MSKKEETKPSTEMVKPNSQGVADLTVKAKQLAGLTSREQLKALEQEMGIDAADVEVIAAGSLPFWPAYAGAMLVGTIQGRREVSTQYRTDVNPSGRVGVYTVRIEGKPVLAGTLDGEIFELNPGDNISVLERTVMKELQTRIGQKVGILCLGKKPSKNGFSYWDYKILGQRRNAEQIQAASQLAMANLQARQLEARHDEES